MPVVSQISLRDAFPEEVSSRSPRPTQDLHTSPTAKMDFLHALMAQQGRPCDGMNWRLLLLEWRYDLTVLSGNIQDWMSYIDRKFDGARN